MAHCNRKRLYECDWEDCQKRFLIASKLKQHKRTHTGEKPYVCDFPGCDAAFAQSGTLAQHKRTHTGVKPYVCDFPKCNAAFAQSTNLASHKLTHTGEKPYVCDFPGCDAAFAKLTNLASHKRTHTGEKPYVCDWPECQAAFAQAGDLTSHKRTHTGEKPYVCDFPGCNAAFALSTNLAKHKRTHTGEKPYVCNWPECGAAFAESGNLASHMRTHTGEKPYVCDFPGCGADFAQSGSLATHKEAWHTERGVQRRKKKEEAVARALTNAGIDFKREHRVFFECAGRTCGYIDFVIILKGRIVILEVDEFQHTYSNYSVGCDLSRIMNVVEAWRVEGCTLSVTVVRWNPDGFNVNGAPRKVKVADRHQCLVRLLRDLDGRPEFEIVYMYYDVADGVPLIQSDPEFEEALKSFCTEVYV